MGEGLDLAAVTEGLKQSSAGERRTEGQREARLHGGSKYAAKKPELSIVVPTRNESENIEPLVEGLRVATVGIRAEIIFVDDSDDSTPARVREVARRGWCRVKLVHRPPGERRGGLGGAVVEGLRTAEAPFVCVMDGDLQHPPEIVPQLLDAALANDADLVVASRYCGGGTTANFGAARLAVSRGSAAVARTLFPGRLSGISDPMSGFFLVRRQALDLDALAPNGFKILLEILVRTPRLVCSEVPFTFGERHAGQSKASLGEGFRFLSLLLALRVGAATAQLTRFSLVGASGLAVNMAALAAFTDLVGLYYLLSAILATQISTGWNFVLTERWVFGGRELRRSRTTRLVLFYAMNNGALALRGPALVLLVSAAGVNYLVANFVSLIGLTIARYAVADLWIWGKNLPARTLAHNTYDIHGIVSVDSEVALPELERFRTEQLRGQPTVRVRIGRLNRKQSDLVATLAFLARHTRYDERLGRLGFGVDIAIGKTIQVVASPLLRHSPHVLYTNVVEPILRWTFPKKGYALVHAACIARGGNAFLVTARTDTGKTTTVLRLLDSDRFAFLSDDLTLLSPDGRVLAYPKPLTVSRHTVSALRRAVLTRAERFALVFQSRLHSRSGRRFAMLLVNARLPVATINAIVQLLVPPPKYHIERLVPEATRARDARLAGLFVIERSGEVSTVPLTSDQALSVLMDNCEDAFGFPPYAQIQGFLRNASKQDLRSLERTLVASALASIPAMLLRSDGMDWAPRMLGALNSRAMADDAEGLVGVPAAISAPAIP
jgi:dolichol-phosphate mannosyltransferase